jgi:hypothetical protein
MVRIRSGVDSDGRHEKSILNQFHSWAEALAAE